MFKENFVKIISFYTKNTGYEQEIKYLIKSANILGYEVYSEGIESLGSWDLNTKYKPFLFLNAMETFPNEDYFLYLDSDAIIYKKIPIEQIYGDIAACHKQITDENQTGWLLSGTVFLKNNQETKRIMKEWIEINKLNPKIFDQETLYLILKKNFTKINIQTLPLEFCKINCTKNKEHCNVKFPIIGHNQASRRFKKQINKGIK
jgi:hypothetical protein